MTPFPNNFQTETVSVQMCTPLCWCTCTHKFKICTLSLFLLCYHCINRFNTSASTVDVSIETRSGHPDGPSGSSFVRVRPTLKVIRVWPRLDHVQCKLRNTWYGSATMLTYSLWATPTVCNCTLMSTSARKPHPYFVCVRMTIVDWNLLPHHLIELKSIYLFVAGVCMHLSS